jgi:hypothetical protein
VGFKGEEELNYVIINQGCLVSLVQFHLVIVEFDIMLELEFRLLKMNLIAFFVKKVDVIINLGNDIFLKT